MPRAADRPQTFVSHHCCQRPAQLAVGFVQLVDRVRRDECALPIDVERAVDTRPADGFRAG